MPLTVTPFDHAPAGIGFAAEITGLDVAQPLDDEARDAVVAALDEYAVVVIRGAPISEEAQVAFARRFGPLEANNGVLNTDIKRRISPDLVDVSNLDEDHALLGREDRRRLFNLGNRLWHTDSSFKRIAAKYSMLNAHTVPPEGGETQFCDMRAAWDALDPATRDTVRDLIAVHCIRTSRGLLGFDTFSDAERAALPPVRRPLVRVHPGSGRECLYLASHAGHVLGRPVAEGRLIIHDLMEHATQARFVFTHSWRLGDLLIWDNRCTMHRARPFDTARYKRDMRRATVLEDAALAAEVDDESAAA